MKTKHSSNKLAIWLPCSVFVALVTACVILANSCCGVLGITAVLLVLLASLQFYKWIFSYRAKHKQYNLSLVVNITNRRISYLIMNISLGFSWLMSTLLTWAENSVYGIPQSVYYVIIILLAVWLSIKPIQPYIRKEKYIGEKRSPAQLINAFVPRFVILYAFVVYFFFSFVTYTTASEIIPSLCVLYIAIERLITMFQIASDYSQQEYYSMFRDTVRWVRNKRKMD